MTSHILVPLDGSEFAEAALPHARALANAFDARLTLARVPETVVVPVVSGGVWITRVVESKEAHQEAESYLDKLAADLSHSGLDVATLTPAYPVAEGLLDAIDSSGADLVAMTTHGRSGLGRWMLGSIAQKLVHHAPIDIYLVRPTTSLEPTEPAFGRLLAPLDGSELGETALAAAAALAEKADATLHLMRIPTIPAYVKIVPETSGLIPEMLRRHASEAEAYLADEVAKLEAQGLDVDADVEMRITGDIAEGILEFADEMEADVVIMSTHGRSGFDRWLLGSVTDRVIRAARVPVWIVRPRSGRSD